MLLAPVLAGCEGGTGFRPLYASIGPGGENVDARLAQVEVSTIPGRVGQRVRNEVVFQNTGGGAMAPPKYRLEVAMRESITSTLVQKTGEAQSQVYNLDASFRLIRLDDKKVVFEGTSFSRASFERYTSIFSNVRAREDAENRAARTVAGDLKGRLAAYLAAPT